jgi:hypothetical protein
MYRTRVEITTRPDILYHYRSNINSSIYVPVPIESVLTTFMLLNSRFCCKKGDKLIKNKILNYCKKGCQKGSSAHHAKYG